jgi:hypothetical protein
MLISASHVGSSVADPVSAYGVAGPAAGLVAGLFGWRIAITRLFISGELKAPVEIGRVLERPVAHSIKGPHA